MKKIVKVATVMAVMFLLSACDSVWKGQAEISVKNGKFIECPDGLRFSGYFIDSLDTVECTGSRHVLGLTQDMKFKMSMITGFSSKNK